MNAFLDRILEFLNDLDPITLIKYFWPFLLFDFVRYLGLDLLLLISYLPKRLSRRRRQKALAELYRRMPLVSIIVPGKNEGRHIPRLARTLQDQQYRNYQLIIVDDGSDDDTEIICRHLQRQGLIDQFIRNDVRGGKASAANTALRFADGEYVLHIDADSYLEPHSIEAILLPFFMDDRVGAVGGDIRVANVDDSWATQFQTIEYIKSITTGRTVASELNLLRIISGAHGLFRRDVLERIKGWDVGPGLDGDITLKIRKLGYRVVHEPMAVCYTHAPIGFGQLARQRYRWDRSLVRFRLRKHKDLLRPRHWTDLASFVSVLDNIVFNLVLNFKWWFYIAQILIFSPLEDKIAYIIVINYGFYLLLNVGEFMVAGLCFGRFWRLREWQLFWYLPLMPLYTGLFIRSVRSYAYVMELIIKASYYDRWNPWKVSRISRENKL